MYIFRSMKLHSRQPHSNRKYQKKEGEWVPYILKHIRQVNLQEMRTTKMRDIIKLAGIDYKIY